MLARITLLVILLAALGWVMMRDDGQASAGKDGPVIATKIDRSSSSTARDESPPLPGKSAARPPKPTVTLEETLELLRTVVPTVSYPDQTLAERTEAINLQLENAGIPPGQLRVKIHANLAKQAESSKWKFEDLELRNIGVAEILKYICGNTKIRYRVRPGVVEFVSATEPDTNAPEPEPLPPGEEDPFGSTPNTVPPTE